MLTMNVFNNDAFSATQLSAAVDKIDYIPQTLSGMPGLILPQPVRTESIWVEERATGFTILPFSPRGSAPHQTGGDPRKARSFKTLRYGDASRITSSELLAIRAWASEVQLKDLQSEVARRQLKMLGNFSLTKEYHIFNLVTQAKVLDSNGDTMWDWATEFEQNLPGEEDWDLDNAAPAEGAVLAKCKLTRRTINKNLKKVGVASEIVGICSDTFYDQLTNHKEVRQTYLNWQQAVDLRGAVGREWDTFRYGNVTFMNYRGTDDGSTLTVASGKAHFFPTGAGIFQMAQSPGERFEHLGQEGQELYSAMVLDDRRNSWADVEVYSYPLPICLMPACLYRAKNT